MSLLGSFLKISGRFPGSSSAKISGTCESISMIPGLCMLMRGGGGDFIPQPGISYPFSNGFVQDQKRKITRKLRHSDTIIAIIYSIVTV